MIESEESRKELIAFKDMIKGKEGEVSGLYCWDCAEEYKRDLGAWEVE